MFFQSDVTRKGKSTRRIEIPVSEHIYGGMTKAELSEARERELQLAQQDKNMERAKDKKNALESYVYEMRSKVNILFQWICELNMELNLIMLLLHSFDSVGVLDRTIDCHCVIMKASLVSMKVHIVV